MSLIKEFKDRIKGLERDLALSKNLPAPVVAEKVIDSFPEYNVTFYGYAHGKEIAKISTPIRALAQMTSQEFADYGSVPKDFIKEMHTELARTGNVEKIDKGLALIHTSPILITKEPVQ